MKRIFKQLVLPARSRQDSPGRIEDQTAPFKAAIDFFRLDAGQGRKAPAQPDAAASDTAPTSSTINEREQHAAEGRS
jgi:hypothetical protein